MKRVLVNGILTTLISSPADPSNVSTAGSAAGPALNQTTTPVENPVVSFGLEPVFGDDFEDLNDVII
jgi:hypothetical protein